MMHFGISGGGRCRVAVAFARFPLRTLSGALAAFRE